MDKKLVVFDFDGTLTRRDSMLEFARYYRGAFRFVLGMCALLPVLLLFKMGLIPNWRAKERFLTHFFRGEPGPKFSEAGSQSATERIPSLLRPAAQQRLEEHRQNGDRVVVVSSSAEDWLSGWCRKMDLTLIATRLTVVNGVITGKLNGPNCYGPEKVSRLRAAFDLDDFSHIIIYGDSKGDHDLFDIGSTYHYKPFRKRKSRSWRRQLFF